MPKEQGAITNRVTANEKHPCFSFDGLWTTSGLLKLFSLIAN